MELEMRIQRIYSAIQASTDTNVAGLTPTRVVDTKELYSAFYDFNGDLSEADLLNMAHGIIHNLANFSDHARKWLRDNRKSKDSIEEVIDKSTALKIAIDLSNSDKHGYPPRDGGRSGVSPKLTKVKRVLAMGEGGGMVLFAPNQPPQQRGPGSASLVLDARVVDKDGNTLGNFRKLMESAASDLETFLTSQGLIVPPRKGK